MSEIMYGCKNVAEFPTKRAATIVWRGQLRIAESERRSYIVDSMILT